jgi:hypothetical protein
MYIQTSNISDVSRELDQMLFDIMLKEGIFIPINKTTYRSKDYLVIKGDNSWNVFKLLKGRKLHCATTFLKVSAFAVAKLLAKNRSSEINEILRLDRLFEKNYLDTLCYKYTIKNSSDQVKKDTALWRYEHSSNISKYAKQKIDAAFYRALA